MAREPGLSADDRQLAITTLSFDIAALELFLPLTVGATVIIGAQDDAEDGVKLAARLASARATAMQATPATWRMLLDAGWAGAAGMKLLCGGEALGPALARELVARGELWNLYGPTETTIWSTARRVTDPSRIAIGRPIANTCAYVLDRHRSPLPVGVAGELYIGGAGLARGYRGRAELTAQRFVAAPFAQARLYRTGDRARYLPSGELEYLGREDRQVKLRGFRIELGEIESVLTRSGAVQQSLVAVCEDATGDARLVAYIVHEPGQSPTPSELRKLLRLQLPDYMVPQLFVELERLPLLQNGKIDRRALPDPFQRNPATEPRDTRPKKPMEELVAEIWREVLKLERVGLYDNFFDVGGHSLLSLQVVHRLEKRTGYRLSPRALVFQTLEQVAAECEPNARASAMPTSRS
jgi:acyl-coenzyme A synthetase/AMP-(fatty) acid ligase